MDGLRSPDPSCIVENILRVGITDHVNVCSKPLLERSSDEEAVGGKPLHEGSRDFFGDLWDGVERGRVVCDGEFVGWVELVCASGDCDLVACEYQTKDRRRRAV